MLGSEDLLASVEGLGQRLARLSEVLTSQTTLRGLERTDGAVRGHEGGLISEKRGADGLEGVQRICFFNIDEALGTHCVDGGLIERIKVRGIASHVLLPSSFLLGALLRASRAPHSILPVRTSSQLTGFATALPWEA